MQCVSRGGCYLVNSYCDLHEDDHTRRESYQACWLSLVLETRPQYKLTLSETDGKSKESQRRQEAVHFMVQRNPNQTLSLGSNGRATTKHQLHGSTSRGLGGATATLGCLKKGDRQEVTAIIHNIGKPIRESFRASSLMSSPRESCHRVQRRE
ncbi:uncharacterized protein zmp:0000000930 [Brachionichthys hirsutus]|uniref:uncharacterized protein zmp:0000000930 n=1 Tax=Brachionichthys hirsutus TaxID=412623 RepID=UPI003605264B